MSSQDQQCSLANREGDDCIEHTFSKNPIDTIVTPPLSAPANTFLYNSTGCHALSASACFPHLNVPPLQ
jgi:hypothetical protein